VTDPDLPWHLDQADAVLRHGSWRYADDTSFTLPGGEYVNHPWLGGLLLHAIWSGYGWTGTVVFAGACATACVLAIGLVARQAAPARPWLAVGLAAIAAGATSWRFEPRPHCLYLVLLPVSLLLAERYATADGKRQLTTSAVALTALGALWAQLHASYILLPVIIALALVGQIATRGLAHGRRLSLPALLLGLVFIAPGGIGYFMWVADISLGDATSFIAEMKPLQLGDLIPTRVDGVLWLDALIVIAVSRTILARRLRIDDVGRALLGLALALTARRFGASWALLLVPWAARSYLEPFASATRRVTRNDRLWSLAAAAAVPYSLATATLEDNPGRGFGLGLYRDFYAVDVTELLVDKGVEGKLFNEYNDGGWLAHRLAPNITIAIDGRTPNYYDSEHFYLYRKALDNPSTFRAIADRYGADMALIFRDRPLCQGLALGNGWHAAYVDSYRTLFVRDDADLGIDPLTHLDACDPIAGIERQCARRNDDPQPLVAELDTMIQLTPEAPFPRLLRARLQLACQRDPHLAVEHIEAALTAANNDAATYSLYAQALALAGRSGMAMTAANRAVELDLGTGSLIVRAHLHLAARNPTAALTDLEQVLARDGDSVSWQTTMAMARALHHSGAHQRAIIYARRALLDGAGPAAQRLLDQIGPKP